MLLNGMVRVSLEHIIGGRRLPRHLADIRGQVLT